MPQLTRNNHFLPRWYLRRWSEDGAQVLVFGLLVSRKEVPSWARKGIASVGSKRDLYTGDFGGGWGNKGTELMLPLSPRHLLYTKVGATAAPRFTMPRFETFQIQRFLAERAHREIIARREERRVSWFRQRVVDAERFADEERQWKQLHEEQRRAEVLEREDGAADIGCRLDRSR